MEKWVPSFILQQDEEDEEYWAGLAHLPLAANLQLLHI
jgi:hypothetical protein